MRPWPPPARTLPAAYSVIVAVAAPRWSRWHADQLRADGGGMSKANDLLAALLRVARALSLSLALPCDACALVLVSLFNQRARCVGHDFCGAVVVVVAVIIVDALFCVVCFYSAAS